MYAKLYPLLAISEGDQPCPSCFLPLWWQRIIGFALHVVIRAEPFCQRDASSGVCLVAVKAFLHVHYTLRGSKEIDPVAELDGKARE